MYIFLLLFLYSPKETLITSATSPAVLDRSSKWWFPPLIATSSIRSAKRNFISASKQTNFLLMLFQERFFLWDEQHDFGETTRFEHQLSVFHDHCLLSPANTEKSPSLRCLDASWLNHAAKARRKSSKSSLATCFVNVYFSERAQYQRDSLPARYTASPPMTRELDSRVF